MEENSEFAKIEDLEQKEVETLCFTYEVNMIVQVLANSKKEADGKLDREGGFVSKRSTIFKDKICLYSENSTKSEDEK